MWAEELCSMQAYRCFFLDDADAVTSWIELEATTDGDATARADSAVKAYSRVAGYTLWQANRLVVVRSGGVEPTVQSHRHAR
jgi:hypothetical protein